MIDLKGSSNLATDVIHLVILAVSVTMLGVGLWMVAPESMFIGIGALGISGIVAARLIGRGRKRVQ